MTMRSLFTGASEPRNMAYMNRLGIWGEGTPFKEFSNFIQAVERRSGGKLSDKTSLLRKKTPSLSSSFFPFFFFWLSLQTFLWKCTVI